MKYRICDAYFSSKSRIRLDFGYQRNQSFPVYQIRNIPKELIIKEGIKM